MRVLAKFACFAVSLGLFACGDEEKQGVETEVVCPDDSTVSYEADIKPFMDKYCVTCHASSVPAASRRGAPTDHNFDTQLGVLAEAPHVDEEAGASATVTNTSMPPRGYPAPSVEERRKLSEWISCTAPVQGEHNHDHD